MSLDPGSSLLAAPYVEKLFGPSYSSSWQIILLVFSSSRWRVKRDISSALLFYHCLRFAAESYFRISFPHFALSFYEFWFLDKRLLFNIGFFVLYFGFQLLNFKFQFLNSRWIFQLSFNWRVSKNYWMLLTCTCSHSPNSGVGQIYLKDIPLELDVVEASNTVTTGPLVNPEGTFSGSGSWQMCLQIVLWKISNFK